MKIIIQEASVKSLFIEIRVQNRRLGTGTGFIIMSKAGPLLITNRHIVTGRNNITDEVIGETIPDNILVHFTIPPKPGLVEWRGFIIELYDDFVPLWYEHPNLGKSADFVAIKLPKTIIDQAELHAWEIEEPDENRKIFLGPTEIVSIIGFPFGQAAGGLFGIWTSGFIASEIEINYNQLPLFLVDCRSREGQSGSPVIVHRKGSATMANGGIGILQGEINYLLGIYSGRINKDSDIGMVWKVSAIKELVESII